LDSGNYTDYTVTKTGGGASGSWGISITGNATSADALNLTHGNELNFSKLAGTGHVWFGYRWNTQGTETSGGTTITTYKFGNANGAGGLAGIEAGTIYENGKSLASQYVAYTEITSITTVTANKKFTCTANTQTYKTFMVEFSYGSTSMVQWFTVTGSSAAYYPIFASMSTNAEAVLSVQCGVGASATITFQFSNGANSPVVERVVGFKFGG
jgi:hypothetical protein